MAETSRHGNANPNFSSIRVGTTGKISSLMNKELESTKPMQEASGSSSGKKCRTSQAIPCGASPRILHPRRNAPVERGQCSSNNNKNGDNNIYKASLDSQKTRQTLFNDGNQIPTLNTDNTTMGRNKLKDKPDKKSSSYIVEVVDLKCNNPMSSRIRKLGFSKLSESIV